MITAHAGALVWVNTGVTDYYFGMMLAICAVNMAIQDEKHLLVYNVSILGFSYSLYFLGSDSGGTIYFALTLSAFAVLSYILMLYKMRIHRKLKGEINTRIALEAALKERSVMDEVTTLPNRSGLMQPDQFIPVLEENGLIVEVGKWILRQVCEDSAEIMAQAKSWPTIAINLSPFQFRYGDFEKDFLNILKTEPTWASHLEFEITEGTLIRETERVVDILNTFSDMGVHMAIDDFGTKYSSYSYIKKFPVDIIKIDREFTKGIPGEKENFAIVRSIITMARELNLHVIAEGIETAEQVEALKTLNCDDIQGFYYSKPLPMTELIPFLQNYKSFSQWNDMPCAIPATTSSASKTT